MRVALILLIIVVGSLGLAEAQSPPSPINDGQTLEGELNNIQRALQYIFSAEAGDTVTILMQTTSGNLDPFLSLATFEGDLIATDDDGAGAGDAVIQVTLETAGAYVVTATRSRTGNAEGEGTFSITLTFSSEPVVAPPPDDPGEVPDTTDGGEAVPAPTTAAPIQEVGERLQPIVRGSTIRGALTTESRFVLYWFEGRNGQNVTVTPDTGTNLQPLLVLYNNNFEEQFRATPGTPLTTTLRQDGIHFVGVALPDALSTGGNYAITLGSLTAASNEPREVEAGQNPITYGERLRGSITQAETAFTFQFTGTEGDTVDISMTRASGDLNSYLFLLDAGGVTVAEDDEGGGTNGDARISTVLPASGTYLILATRQGRQSGTTTGSFLISLQSDAETPVPDAPTTNSNVPPNLAEFPEIFFGETVSGAISGSDFLDVYIFQASGGDEIVLEMISTSTVDPLLILLDANQVPLLENDDVADGVQDARIEYTVPETGYFVVVATRFQQAEGTSEGPYQLTVNRAGEEGNQGSLVQRLNPERLTSGATPQGSFAELRFAEVYTFATTEANATIDFSVAMDDNSATTVIITDERLQPIASTDTGTLLEVAAPEPGNYLIFIAPANGPIQPVDIGFVLAFNSTDEGIPTDFAEVDEDDDTSSEPTTTLIAYDQTLTGTIDDGATSQNYVFTGLGGDIIRISMRAASGSTLDTLVQLLDESGTVIAENDDILPGENRNSLLELSLPDDGQYTIVATRYEPIDGTTASTGAYELQLSLVPPEQIGINAIPINIAAGETLSNFINDDQRLLFYTFTANSGDLVTIEVNQLSGDLDAVLYLYAYTSAGEPIEIARNDDSPLGNTFDPLIEAFPMPRAGTYLVAVGRFPSEDPEAVTSGDFSITLRVQPPSATPVEEAE